MWIKQDVNLRKFLGSVWNDHHHWPGYCVRDDWHVWRSVRDGCRHLSAHHHSGERHYIQPAPLHTSSDKLVSWLVCCLDKFPIVFFFFFLHNQLCSLEILHLVLVHNQHTYLVVSSGRLILIGSFVKDWNDTSVDRFDRFTGCADRMLSRVVVCSRVDRVAAGRAAAERLRFGLGYFSLHCHQHLWNDCMESLQSNYSQHRQR